METLQPYSQAVVPTEFGDFTLQVYKDVTGIEHAVLIKGDKELFEKETIPVRIHSQCLTSESFLALKCDCKQQLEMSMDYIHKQKIGVIVYLMQEGRGIGLGNKIKAYDLQNKGFDTIEANIHLGFKSDQRQYYFAVQILQSLKISKIALLTNNPDKIKAFENSSISIEQRIPVIAPPSKYSQQYLHTKKEKLGHYL